MSIDYIHDSQRPTSPENTARPLNNLLRRLSASDYSLLSAHLEHFDCTGQHLLYSAGDNVEFVYFPCGVSLVSYLVSNEDGRDVEAILVGREGAVGGIVSHGYLPAYCRIVAKFGGTFTRLRISALESAKQRSRTLENLFSRYADCLLAQIFQSTACNAIHPIEQRAAKWMIAAIERTGERNVPLTHEQLAAMLGVGRSYTSRVIQTFKADGILTTRRGVLVVNDIGALQERSCLCNESVKSHFETVLSGVYPQQVDP